MVEMENTDGSSAKPLLRLDTNSRFIQDDVSYGLCVLLGLGEIVDQPMHYCRAHRSTSAISCKRICCGRKGAWRLKGRDVAETGAPQAYGVFTQDALAKLSRWRAPFCD